MLLRSTAPQINKYSKKAYKERKRLREKNIKCPKAKFIRICIKKRENPQREERLRKFFFVFLCGLTFSLGIYTERRKTKNKMENFLNLNESFHREKKG
jgi:hypothetical protein